MQVQILTKPDSLQRWLIQPEHAAINIKLTAVNNKICVVTNVGV